MYFYWINANSFVYILFFQLVFFKAVDKGYFHNYYYGDAILYALFTAVIFHAVSYILIMFWRLLLSMCDDRHCLRHIT